MEIQRSAFNRRAFLSVTGRLGLASTLFPGVLYAMAEEKKKVNAAMINEAAAIAGVNISDEYKEMMLDDLNGALEDYEAIRALKLPNSVSPALLFDPLLPGTKLNIASKPIRMSPARQLKLPKDVEELAFWNVRDLGELIRTRKISSATLTLAIFSPAANNGVLVTGKSFGGVGSAIKIPANRI